MANSFRPHPDAMLNPRCDAIFKALFTDNSAEGQTALKSFLEAVLTAKVSDIRLIPNEAAVESESDRQTVFDITCVLNDSEAVNIEMQGLDITSSYDKRAEYNVAHLLNHYTPKGTKWKDIPKVFQISVLNFIYDATTHSTFSVYTMQTDQNRKLSGRMAVIFIELPKVLKNSDDTIEGIEKLTPAEKWGKFLIYADDEERKDYIKALCAKDGGIMAAQTILSKISQDEIHWVHQNSVYKANIDQLSAISEATERGMEDGLQIGLEQGIQKGLEQGMQQGIMQTKIATAKRLLAKGFSLKEAADFTELSAEELKKII